MELYSSITPKKPQINLQHLARLNTFKQKSTKQLIENILQ